jgi:hypothetical protein
MASKASTTASPELTKRLLLGMKRCFLRLHFLNELSEPFIRQLVRYAGHKGAVVIDLLVEFGALFTHSSFRIGANTALIGCCL